ncbi:MULTISPECIES: nuclear transport factor 2 family protein [Microbacterium]|uniref:nuclear transport factor 2 family protein n=1 Tax=Microbacterium TaxID=33882 RepID=UPI000D642DEF|nr:MULTISPECIES: nuclear transport factor 2 family protein [Microbacterium]
MDIDELLGLERRGWQSLCDGDGADFYGEIMSSDGVMVLANGVVMDRATVTQSLADAPPWDSFRIEEPQIVPAGDDSAVLVYRGVAIRRGDSQPFEALMTSVYVKTDERIHLVSYQQTPVVR